MKFIVTDLGTQGGTFSLANGINDAGQVTGYASTAGEATYPSFLWQSGQMQTLGNLKGGSYSLAYGINASAQIVGLGNSKGGTVDHAFVWQSGSMTDLGTLGGTISRAYAINDAGLIVGTSTTASNDATHGFVWQSGTMRDLGTLGGNYSAATGINASGQVVGNSTSANSTDNHAFVWQSGRMQGLGTLGGTVSEATGINAAGQIVGRSSTSGPNASHAFVWQSGGMTDLGTLGGSESGATGINGAGEIVGYSIGRDAISHGFLNTAQGGMLDLNTMLAGSFAGDISRANAINDAGQIVVSTVNAALQTRAALLTPTGSITWLAGGAGGSFTDGANWEQGFAPSKFLDAVIATTGIQTIHAGIDAGVKTLTLGSAAGGSGRPELILQNGATLTAINGVTVQATGTLGGDGRISGSLVNFGTVQVDNLSVSGGLSNSGTVQGNGYLNASVLNGASGVVHVGAGDTLHLVGQARNEGTVEVLDGGTLVSTGGLTNASGGRIFLQSGRLNFADAAVNSGQINVTFGTSDIHGSLTTLSGGKVLLSGNSNTTFYDLVDIQMGGELRVSRGSTAVFFGQVAQRTGAVFSGTGAKFYEGGLSVGASPGLGQDGGDVSFGSGNVYLAEIGGLAAGTGFDKYEVAGALGFGGTLKVVWWGGFKGQAGQSFDLFDWGSRTGTFADIDLSGAKLDAGLTWDISKLYSSGEVSISAVPEPTTWGLLLLGLSLVGVVLPRRVRHDNAPMQSRRPSWGSRLYLQGLI